MHPEVNRPGRLSIQLEPPEAAPSGKRELGQFSMRYVIFMVKPTTRSSSAALFLVGGIRFFVEGSQAYLSY